MLDFFKKNNSNFLLFGLRGVLVWPGVETQERREFEVLGHQFLPKKIPLLFPPSRLHMDSNLGPHGPQPSALIGAMRPFKSKKIKEVIIIQ